MKKINKLFNLESSFFSIKGIYKKQDIFLTTCSLIEYTETPYCVHLFASSFEGKQILNSLNRAPGSEEYCELCGYEVSNFQSGFTSYTAARDHLNDIRKNVEFINVDWYVDDKFTTISREDKSLILNSFVIVQQDHRVNCTYSLIDAKAEASIQNVESFKEKLSKFCSDQDLYKLSSEKMKKLQALVDTVS